MNPRGRLVQPSLPRFTDWPSGVKKDGLLARFEKMAFALA